MGISIIIPVLNEEGTIQATLRSLPSSVEPIVVDGGSTDRTCERAEESARVIRAPRGRARQLNAGAKAATEDLLLFLHADTRLPKEAFREISRTVEAGYVGGGFLGRFDSNHLLFRFGYPFRDLRTRLFFEIYGDQGIFVRRDVFEALGGYRDFPILEDYEFIQRLRKSGPVRVIPYPIVMSARRYLKHGILRQHFRNLSIIGRYLWGVDPRNLVQSYEGTGAQES